MVGAIKLGSVGYGRNQVNRSVFVVCHRNRLIIGQQSENLVKKY